MRKGASHSFKEGYEGRPHRKGNLKEVKKLSMKGPMRSF